VIPTPASGGHAFWPDVGLFMMIRFKQFFTLTGLALTDLFRQPATLLIVLTNLAATILVPLAISHQLGQQTHLAVDSALAFEFVFGVILAGYAACSTLHDECRSGTILIVFSKPVGRLMFFLAKFTAVTLLLLFFVYCSSAAALLAERLAPRNFEYDTLGIKLLLATPFTAFIPAALLNYRSQRSFVPTALLFFALTLSALVLILSTLDREGHRVLFGSMMDWRILPACLLEGVALLLLAALAISLATRLAAPATISIMLVLLFMGLVSDHLANLLGSVPPLGFALRMILPDIQSFWPADSLAAGGSITGPMFRHAAIYAILYGTGILCFGFTAFRNRQF
jgi:ABC-type transport system involved in multi-copper enzyme maturation permease subunit